LFAGLRIASVTLVGLVTVTALIGQGGLGQLLLSGFNQDFLTPIVVSVVLSLVLSFLFDSLIARVGYWLTLGTLMDILTATWHWLIQPDHWLSETGILLPARASLVCAGEHGHRFGHCTTLGVALGYWRKGAFWSSTCSTLAGQSRLWA
jgi:hypothetical protein